MIHVPNDDALWGLIYLVPIHLNKLCRDMSLIIFDVRISRFPTANEDLANLSSFCSAKQVLICFELFVQAKDLCEIRDLVFLVWKDIETTNTWLDLSKEKKVLVISTQT